MGLKSPDAHHRRALDVAAKKQADKNAEKDAKVIAGERAGILQRLLELDPDADIYLLDPSGSGRVLCRSHFRFDRCSNRRCKLSHEFSIGQAVRSSSSDAENDVGELPALTLVPSLGKRQSTKQPSSCDAVASAAGPFQSLTAIVIAAIAAQLGLANVAAFEQSCRYLRLCLVTSKPLLERRTVALEATLRRRNSALLSKTTAARLAFAVSHANAGYRLKDGKQQPALAYDFEDPYVFRTFEASRVAAALSGMSLEDAAVFRTFEANRVGAALASMRAPDDSKPRKDDATRARLRGEQEKPEKKEKERQKGGSGARKDEEIAARRSALESEAIRAADEEARQRLAALQASGPRMPKPRVRAADAAPQTAVAPSAESSTSVTLDRRCEDEESLVEAGRLPSL